MSYTALYRKFRPQEFEDVKGQEHIVTTLKNQIKADRVGHAYLFCGTRGTGKTTIAKIFAKAVNCQEPREGSPCGDCPSCREIAAGNSMNVIEIDAASNNGVDNIREIREEVAYSPTKGKYKVYIIGEVHMLSMGAFNALLKTLEEPPSYVIFILATTEAHKIPITILSRCQRYDFKRITVETIAGRLSELMEKEQVAVEDKAIRYVARAADGSMRDALSLLDQCIAFYLGETLTYDHVLEVLGAVDTEVFSQMLRRILSQDVTGALLLLEELIGKGREPGQFVVDFTWYLRNLLLLQSTENIEDALDISTENQKLLREEASMVEMGQLMRYIRIFSELSSQIRYAVQKRILIEVALIKLCKPQMERDYDSLAQRVAQLEQKVEEGVLVQPASPAEDTGAAAWQEASRKQSPTEEEASLVQAAPEDIRQVIENWNTILEGLPGGLKNFLKTAELIPAGGNTLSVIMENEVKEAFVNTEAHIKELTERIQEKTGKSIEVQIRAREAAAAKRKPNPDFKGHINMEVTFEDGMG